MATNVCGPYNTNQTWTITGSPYIATCDVTIGGGATLTINAGVQVKFNSGTGLFIGNGTVGGLSAVGTSTPSQHITFTANNSTTPGFWQGIIFYSQTTAASQIKYADVSYGGGGSHGGIHVSGVSGTSPTIQNVTSANNAYAGIRIQGGSPAISNSSFLSNPVGVEVGFGVQPSGPSITGTTISSNSGFALNLDANVTLGTVSGLTFLSNGTNGASIGGTVAVNTTWKSLGVPYFLPTADVFVNAAAPSSATLTVPAGTTVKFGSGRTLFVGTYGPGGLQAVGTSSQGITFTGMTSSQGFWRYIIFSSQTLASSTIAYATVSYAERGVYFYAGPGTVDHVTFSSNSIAGVAAINSATPVITNCNFSGNTAGLSNESPSTLMTARFNWWNHLSGPSGSGPGSGQSVSSGVIFEPWLGTAASTPQYFTSFSLANTTFNPLIGINANFSFGTFQSGNWTFRIYNGSTLVRTITGTGTTGSPQWNGQNDGGTLQPNALYTYQIDSTAGSNVAAPLRGRVTLDTNRQLAVNSLTVAPAYFSPDGNGVQDTTTLTGITTFDGATWTVNVKNSGGTIVRTATGPANPNISYTWDGKNGSGVVQPDGVYTLQLVVTDGTASVTYTPTVTLDKTAPVATITLPWSGATLSNLFQSGSANVTVTGTASDANIQTWTLDYGAGSSPSSWTTIATGSTSVTSSTLGTWATLGSPLVPNGLYTLRLTATDKAGTVSTTQRSETIANFSVTQNVLEFNGTTPSAAVTYTSIVPSILGVGALTETLIVKNAGGGLVKTVRSGVVSPGTFQDNWDGTDAFGVLQVDGPYYYTATFSNVTYTMTWDLTNQYLNDGLAWANNAIYDWNAPFMAFNNAALAISYTTPFPLRLSLLFTPYYIDFVGPYPPQTACNDPGSFCTVASAYQETGTHSYTWASIDNTGTFRMDILGVAAIGDRLSFSKNAVILFGSKPTLTNLQTQPANFNPSSGSMAVTATATSSGSKPVTVTLKVTNQSSNSILRTITLSNQAVGSISVNWDGKADNGMWVAPGRYTISLTIADTRGQTVTKNLLAVIGY